MQPILRTSLCLHEGALDGFLLLFHHPDRSGQHWCTHLSEPAQAWFGAGAIVANFTAKRLPGRAPSPSARNFFPFPTQLQLTRR
jgi:hypothetical protein